MTFAARSPPGPDSRADANVMSIAFNVMDAVGVTTSSEMSAFPSNVSASARGTSATS